MPRIADILGVKVARCSFAEKVIYNTPEAAELARKRMQRRSRVEISKYECFVCGGWHIGRPTPKDR